MKASLAAEIIRATARGVGGTAGGAGGSVSAPWSAAAIRRATSA